MSRIGRRKMLSYLAALPAAFLPAPAWASRSARRTSAADLVDAHCHVFNVTDLTATKFALAFIGIFPRPLGPTEPEAILERLIRRIVNRLSARVPSAASEADMLGLPLLAPPGVAELTTAEEEQVDTLRTQAEAAAREVERQRALPPGPADRCRPAGGGGIAWSVGAVVKWVRALRLYRHQLVRSLAARHEAAGYRPRLLCPALVDYSNWLGERLRSPLPDQVCVMGKIAALPELPAVHGYAPFDPLRLALFRHGIAGVDGDWDPMGLMDEALTGHGFAGVKLYPPMGFRPAGNAADAGALYPPAAAALPGGAAAVGAHLDAALDELWDYCLRNDVPVMAHGANSNEGGEYYGYRADPTHWVALMARRPRLRVMLAHFGGFDSVALGHGVPGKPCPWPVSFEDSWEGVIGRYVERHPGSHLYADISFLGEIYDRRDRERSAERLRQYLRCDPDARHLVFGSDWLMLGIHRGWGRRPYYASRVAAFLRDCGIVDEKLERVMQGNALRFLGLAERDPTRERLLHFYAENGLPPDRLPLAA